jgi:hypothetical protein
MLERSNYLKFSDKKYWLTLVLKTLIISLLFEKTGKNIHHTKSFSPVEIWLKMSSQFHSFKKCEL